MAWKRQHWTRQTDEIAGSCGLDLDYELASELPTIDPSRPPLSPALFRPNATPAASAALQEPRLMELILLKIDMKTLLLSQRVSKFWQTTIKESTKLQKKLYLTPATVDELISLGIADHNSVFVVPPKEESTTCPPTDFVMINPLINAITLPDMPDHDDSLVRLRLPEGLHPSQSWNKMFATQPPVRDLNIREVMRERQAYERNTGKTWVVPGLEPEMHIWVKGYAASYDAFKDSIDRREKLRTEMTAKDEKWEADDEAKIIKRRAQVFNRYPENYTMCR